MIRTLPVILGAISFIVVIGGGTYEHLSMVPVWASAPPASLMMFQGEYAIIPQKFWMSVHPITLILLTLALITNWKARARGYISTTIVGYAAILAATFIFFVPELLSITQTAYNSTIDADLMRRAKMWETLSLVRLGFLYVLAVILLFGVRNAGIRDA